MSQEEEMRDSDHKASARIPRGKKIPYTLIVSLSVSTILHIAALLLLSPSEQPPKTQFRVIVVPSAPIRLPERFAFAFPSVRPQPMERLAAEAYPKDALKGEVAVDSLGVAKDLREVLLDWMEEAWLFEKEGKPQEAVFAAIPPVLPDTLADHVGELPSAWESGIFLPEGKRGHRSVIGIDEKDRRKTKGTWVMPGHGPTPYHRSLYYYFQRHTGIRVQFSGKAFDLDSGDLDARTYPVIFRVLPFRAERHVEDFVRYLIDGGFLIAPDYGRQASSNRLYRQMKRHLETHVGSRARFGPISEDHPILHSFYDLRALGWPATFHYLQGIELDGRVVAVFGSLFFIYGHPAEPCVDARRENKLTLNLAFFALTQPGSMAHQVMLNR